MGLGGSLLFKAAALAAVSATSLPGIPLCPGVHKRFVGPDRALRRDPPSETWSTRLVMPAQPAPGECQRKYK